MNDTMTEQRYTVDSNVLGTQFWIADEIAGDISGKSYRTKADAQKDADKFNARYINHGWITVLDND